MTYSREWSELYHDYSNLLNLCLSAQHIHLQQVEAVIHTLAMDSHCIITISSKFINAVNQIQDRSGMLGLSAVFSLPGAQTPT